MLDQHQSPAAGTKGLDANKLTLLFTVRVQYDMDRITGDVLYLLYEIRIPILFRVSNANISASRPSEIGRREKEWRTGLTLNTAFAPNLRISP